MSRPDTEPRAALQNRGGQYGMGIPYEAPTAGDAADPDSPTRAGIALRIVLSVVLGVLGLWAVVRLVLVVFTAPDSQTLWGAFAGTAVLAAVLLFYPVANVVRLVRSRR
jgi:hypothetical protein